MHVFAGVFAAALEVAAPVLIALLITDVAFGIVSRVVPQLSVFVVGFPVKVAVTLLLVGRVAPVHRRLDQRTDVGERRRGARRAEGGRERWPAKSAQRSRQPSTENAPATRARSPRSSDLSGSLVLLAGLMVVAITGPRIISAVSASFRGIFAAHRPPERRLERGRD